MHPDALPRKVYRLLRNVYRTSRMCPTVGDGLLRLGSLYGSNAYVARLLPEEPSIRFSFPEPIGRLRLTVRNNAGADAYIFREVFESKMYSLRLAAPPATVLDLGANAGYASVYFARRYPGAALACVEPVPRNVGVLRRNLESNGIPARVFGAAVSVEDGTLRMDVGQKDYGHKVVDAAAAGASTIDVPALSMQTILRELGWDRVGLLKIDIEGYERELLRKSCDWLSRVDAIAIECHAPFGPKDLEAVAATWGFGAPEPVADIWLTQRVR